MATRQLFPGCVEMSSVAWILALFGPRVLKLSVDVG